MDPVANMLSQIKNAGAAGKTTIAVPYSKFRHAIAEALLREGYLVNVERKGRKTGKVLELEIAYENNRPKIKEAKRVSKLSRRTYAGARDLRPVRQGYGNTILSTPKGVLTLAEAKKEGVGGEVLFSIW